MKLKYFETSVFAFLFLFAIFFTSCNEEWDQHYNDVSVAAKSDLNLYEYIKSKDNLSTFTQMLQVTGYDKILSSSQVFTVWAPENDALSGIDPNNATLSLEIVKNHVARYSYTTSGVTTMIIPMVNGKLLSFKKATNGYIFNSEMIVTADLGTANGILHIVGGYAPYKMNIWEFINQTAGLDSLKDYINSLSVRKLDSIASYDSNGILVDSIFKIDNVVLNNLGRIDVEDSIYTAFLPDNLAWSELYNRISPYYKTLPADGGVAQQRVSTCWSLVKNLFFRGEKTLPLSENKLTSTGNITFYDPTPLFDNTQMTTLSNGLAYVASNKLNIADTASWYKPLKMETEYYSNYGATLSNYTASVLSSIGTGYAISHGYYIYLKDASLSSLSKLYGIFPIPSTLSAKYNIYCVFVPKQILDPNDMRPYKVKFTLNYINSQGKSVSGYVDANHNVQSSSSSLATFITDPTKLDKVLVTSNFEFPYSNVVFKGNTTDDILKQIKFSLKVENATAKTGTDPTIYSRDILIDCIILEPVQ
ncbi:conserved hypothetical protein [uncultured Paludibacter sp.]|nr:conserved hypothetical protein [uncultured Paludibacter sp.]